MCDAFVWYHECRIHVHNMLGVKFYVIVEPNFSNNLDQLLHSIYELYTDFVLKVLESVVY